MQDRSMQYNYVYIKRQASLGTLSFASITISYSLLQNLHEEMLWNSDDLGNNIYLFCYYDYG